MVVSGVADNSDYAKTKVINISTGEILDQEKYNTYFKEDVESYKDAFNEEEFLQSKESIDIDEDKRYDNSIARFFAKIYLRLFMKKYPGQINLDI